MSKPVETNSKTALAPAGKNAVPTPLKKPTDAANPAASGAQTTAAKARPVVATAGSPAAPRSWEDIKIGSLVLAAANEGIEYGWWEAVVTEFTGDLLGLRWRDYPAETVRPRRVSEVALLFPRK